MSIKPVRVALVVVGMCACASSSRSDRGGNTVSTPDPAESNKAVVRRFYDAVNQQRDDLFAAVVAPSFVDHTNDVRGPAGVATSSAALHRAFADLRFRVVNAVADGELVAVQWVYTGRNVGQFFGLPPTGQPVEQKGVNFFRVQGGLITDAWLAVDPKSLRARMQQAPK
jgi:steroid delta-isomerase-like uncharacterized protein